MKQELQDIINYYQNDSSYTQSERVIAMLTELQEQEGYLCEELQQTVAKAAGVNLGYVKALIKRLPHLHARPFRHEIQVCISERCKAKGGSDVLKELQRLLKVKPGQTTRDGRFLLTTRYCMHRCLEGPNMTVNQDHYGGVTPADLPSILKKYH